MLAAARLQDVEESTRDFAGEHRSIMQLTTLNMCLMFVHRTGGSTHRKECGVCRVLVFGQARGPQPLFLSFPTESNRSYLASCRACAIISEGLALCVRNSQIIWKSTSPIASSAQRTIICCASWAALVWGRSFSSRRMSRNTASYAIIANFGS